MCACLVPDILTSWEDEGQEMRDEMVSERDDVLRRIPGPALSGRSEEETRSRRAEASRSRQRQVEVGRGRQRQAEAGRREEITRGAFWMERGQSREGYMQGLGGGSRDHWIEMRT